MDKFHQSTGKILFMLIVNKIPFLFHNLYNGHVYPLIANEEFNTIPSGPKCLFNFSFLKYIVKQPKETLQMTAAIVMNS